VKSKKKSGTTVTVSVKPKDTEEVRKLKEAVVGYKSDIKKLTNENSKRKKKITDLNKKIKALDAENKMLKATGVFPPSITTKNKDGTVRRKSRFELIDMGG
jgi:predicted RNase H-like nuclease (RuvC/YqgF family)